MLGLEIFAFTEKRSAVSKSRAANAVHASTATELLTPHAMPSARNARGPA